jgi:hypothetical protein
MPEHPRQDKDDQTGQYGGDDGALEHEREKIQPGEDSAIQSTPTTTDTPADQAQRKQQRDLESGEENPG